MRSPINGKLVELDLNHGILSIAKYQEEDKEALFSPVDGKITSISSSFIEIESENLILKADKAQGEEVMGKLLYIQDEMIGILQSYDQIEKSIVLCKSASEAILVKFSVIGVLGIIMVSTPKITDLTWMQINEGTFEKLMKFDGQKVWLMPDEKQIILLE